MELRLPICEMVIIVPISLPQEIKDIKQFERGKTVYKVIEIII